MAENVEEKIVAAKFDSSDFEKGVSKTVEKLDELKKNLNFDKTGESIADLSKKTKEATESMGNNVEKLTERITSFTGMIKQKLLGRLADEVVGTLFKVRDSIFGFFNNMTFGQISSGLSKYESALTSVRMITNAFYTDLKTNKKINYGESEVYQSIENLQRYADETSYSMDQMSDAMSKMVAAGVRLEDAEKNVQGIANACAAAGINAQDASRAFFNLSQAYSSGGLKYTDYRSLELLNMTNENFVDSLIAAAEAAGTLKKVKDGIWKTQKSESNKKVTAGKQVTKKNITESLRYNFADNDVMDILFGQNYYVDVADFLAVKELTDNTEERIQKLLEMTSMDKLVDKEIKDVIKNLDSKDERKKRYLEYGKDKKDKSKQTAYLKELKHDSELVTKAENAGLEKIVKSLDDASQIKKNYYAKSNQKERDEYLQSIKEEAEIVDKLPKKYNKIQVASFMAGREARNFNDVIQAIGEYVSSKFSKVFERMFGTLEIAKDFFTDLSEFGIAEIFTGIADWIDEVSEFWDTGNNQVVSGGALFRDAIKDVGGAIAELAGIIGDVFPSTQDFGELLYGLTMEFRRGAGDIRSWLAELRAWFNTKASAEETMTRMQKLQTILANLSGSFTIIGNVLGIAIGAIDRGLRLVSPIFEEVLDGLIGATQPISDLSNNSEAFDDLSNSITNVFVILEPLVDLLTPFISKLGEIIGIVSGFFIGGSISVITTNIDLIASTVRLLIDLFGTKEMKEAAAGGSTLEAIANDIKGIGDACKEAFTAVKDFFTALIGDVRELFGLPREAGEAASKDNQNNGGLFSGIQNFFETNEFIKKAEAWFEQAKKDIRDWIIHLPEKVNEFIHNLLYRKVAVKNENKNGKSFDAEGQQGTIDYIETPLKWWFDSTVANVKKFFDDFPQNFTKAINEIGSIWTKVKEALSSLFYTKVVNKNENKNGKSFDVEGQQGTIDYIETPLKIWFDGVVAKVKTFIENIPQNFTNSVGSIWKKVNEAIASLFTEKVNSEGGGKKFDTEGQAMSEYVEIPFTKWIANLTKSINSKRKEVQKSLFSGIKKWFDKEENIKVVHDFIQSIVDAVKQFVLDLPKKIIETIKNIGSVGRTIVSVIKDIFKPSDVAEGTQKQLEEGVEQINLTWFFESIKNIGIEIANQFASLFTGTDDIEANIAWFNETVVGFIKEIPGKIWGAFRWVNEKFGEYWDKLFIWITGGDDTNPDGGKRTSAVLTKLNEIFPKDGEGSIGDFIRGIPGLIQAAFKDAGEAIGALWDGLMDALNGKKQIKEPTEAEKKINAMAGDPRFFGKSKWQQLAEDISSAIVDTFKQLPQWISDGLDDAILAVSSALDSVTKLMGEALAGETEEPSTAVAKVLEPSPNKEESALTKSLKSLGSHLIKLITEKIPAFITTGFSLIKEKASDWWAVLSDAFDTFSTDPEVQKKIEDIGTKIEEWIKGIPERVRKAVADLRIIFERIFGLRQDAMLGDPRFIAKSVNEELNKTGENVEKEGKKSTIFDSIKTVGEGIGHAFKTVFDDLGPDIENFVKDIPTHLVNGLNWAVGGIDSALKWVIDQLTSSENVKKDSDQQMKDLEKDAKDKAEEAAKTAAEGASESKGVFNDSFAVALGGLFTTVKTVITDTLPKAITAGFDAIKKNAGGWLEALKNIFVGTEGLDETEVNTDSLVDRIRVAIQELPEKIKKFWEEAKENIKKFFANPNEIQEKAWDETQKSISRSDFSGFEKEREAQEFANKYGTSFKKGVNGSSLFDDIKSVGTTISQALTEAFEFVANNFGPILIQGYNSTLDTISKLLTALSTWISGGANEEDGSLGKAISSVFPNMESSFHDALTNIGLTIKNLFLHIIPHFIGEAIGTLIHDLPTMWDELWGGIGDSLDASAEKEKQPSSTVEGAEAAIEKTGNVIEETIASMRTGLIAGTLSTSATIIVGLLALMEIFKLIKEVISTFNVAGNMAEKKQASNSIEAVFKRMLTALIAAMALVVYVGTLDDTKFNHVKEVLTMLTDTIKTLAELFTVGSFGGGLLELINNGNKSDKAAEKAAKKTLTNKEKTVGSLVDIFGSISGGIKKVVGSAATAIGVNLIGSSVSDVISQFIGNFADMGVAVNIFSENLGKTFDDISKLLEKIQNAQKVLEAVNGLMSLMIVTITYKDEVDTVNSMLGDMTGSFGLFAKQFEGNIHAAEVVQAIKDIIGMTGDITTFAGYVTDEAGAFETFKYAIGSLGASLSFYHTAQASDAEEMTATGITNAVKLLKAIVNNKELQDLTKSFGSGLTDEDAKDLYRGAEQMSLVAGALSQFGNSIIGLKIENVEAFNEFYSSVIKEITVDDVQGNTEGITTFSQKMHTLGSGLQSFATAVTGITSDQVKIAGYALEMLGNLAERAKHFKHGALVGWVAGSGDLGQFALDVGSLAITLRDFLHNISIDEDGNTIETKFEQIKIAMFALQQIGVAASRSKGMDSKPLRELLSDFSDGENLGNKISKVIGGLLTVYIPEEITNGKLKGKYKAINKDNFNFEFLESILTSFNKFTQSISALKVGNFDLASTFRTIMDDSIGIVPIANKIMETFNTINTSEFKDGIDMTYVGSVVEIVSTLFDAIKGLHIFNVVGTGYELYDAAEAMSTVLQALDVINSDLTILSTFLDNMQTFVGKYSINEIYTLVDLIRVLGEGLNYFATNNISDTSYAMDGLLNLQTLQPELLTDALTNILKTIQAYIDDKDNAELLKNSGKTMAQYIYQGMDLAFQDPSENLQPHITPILNLDTARSQLSEFFGLADPETFNITSALTDSVQSAFSLLNKEEQPNYTELLTSIDEKVSTVGTKLDNIPDAVSKMKVYLDTGVLVGEMAGPMDRALALFGDQYARQVAISFGSPMNIVP